MYRLVAFFSVIITAAVSLVIVGGAAADPHPGGCPAFGQFMGTSAPWSGQNQRPLGQTVRQLTPFSEALVVFKGPLCG